MKPKNNNSNIRSASLIGLLLALTMILAACNSSAQANQALTVATQAVTQPVAPAQEATINVAIDPALGKILVDGKGMTLYMFTKDEAGKSNCDADCLAKWPPLLTQGNPSVGAGVDGLLVGFTTLADGSRIVTYNNMPLYYWVNDARAGDTTGQGVGSVWYVVSPAGIPLGVPITVPATAEPAASLTEPSLNVASDPAFGQYLVDGKGMALYIFTKDGRDQSNCDADCLAKWPPLLTQGNPSVGAGVDASEVGIAFLADGSKIVTYDHHPLYYWVNDTKPGDVSGQGVGGVWFLISPSGKEIDDSPQALADPSPDPTPDPVPSANEPTITVASSPSLGEYLVDGKGMTLYIYTRDTAGKSNCSGDCLVAWPPLLTQGNPILGPGADDSKLGSALLADGTRIVTYNLMPLYYYIQDTKPGDINGQGVGSVWYVIDRDGDIISR